MKRLGIRQVETLIAIASPTMALVIGDDVSASLVKRGLAREREPGAFVCITASGLRALAQEMDAGRVDDALERMRKDFEARQARRGKAA